MTQPEADIQGDDNYDGDIVLIDRLKMDQPVERFSPRVLRLIRGGVKETVATIYEERKLFGEIGGVALGIGVATRAAAHAYQAR